MNIMIISLPLAPRSPICGYAASVVPFFTIPFHLPSCGWYTPILISEPAATGFAYSIQYHLAVPDTVCTPNAPSWSPLIIADTASSAFKVEACRVARFILDIWLWTERQDASVVSFFPRFAATPANGSGKILVNVQFSKIFIIF